jgi:hypothetical protein
MAKAHAVAAAMTLVGYDDTVDILVAEIHKNGKNDFENDVIAQGGLLSDYDDSEVERRGWEYALREPKTDIDILGKGLSNWSVPRQDLVGGVLFFFLTAKALINAKKIMKQAPTHPDVQAYPQIMETLERNYRFIEANQASLIAAAQVTGIAEYGGHPGMRGGFYGDIKEFHFFKNPLPYTEVKKIVVVNATIHYSLHGDKADWLRSAIAQTNKLPAWLERKMFGTTRYADLVSDWYGNIRTQTLYLAPEDTASPEGVIRQYYLNFLIAEIQDSETKYHAEVHTTREGSRTGIADYMVCIQGHWIPIEAKVTVAAERDILGQIQKYTGISSFGRSTTMTEMTNHGICLIGDQYGIYLCKDGAFVDCDAHTPLWPRTGITKKTPQQIRDRVRKLLQ